MRAEHHIGRVGALSVLFFGILMTVFLAFSYLFYLNIEPGTTARSNDVLPALILQSSESDDAISIDVTLPSLNTQEEPQKETLVNGGDVNLNQKKFKESQQQEAKKGANPAGYRSDGLFGGLSIIHQAIANDANEVAQSLYIQKEKTKIQKANIKKDQKKCQKGLLHWSCQHPSQGSQPDAILKDATAELCSSVIAKDFYAYVDCRFLNNYKRHFHDNGWAPAGFVTYVRGDKYKKLTQLLIDSNKYFSKLPILVFCIDYFVPEWNEEDYPNMVVFHMPLVSLGLTFDFNKIKAMILSKLKVGMIVDSDQILAPAVDQFFSRIPLYINEAYPYPILPTHWMSRDPEGGDMPEYVAPLSFYSEPRSTRWGHAHPSWAYQALPFTAKMYYKAYVDKVRIPDEDYMNFMTWDNKLTRQFCKYDHYSSIGRDIITHHIDGLKNFGADKKWFPQGIPILPLTGHGNKNVEQMQETLTMFRSLNANLLAGKDAGLADRAEHFVFFNGTYFSPDEYMRLFPKSHCVV